MRTIALIFFLCFLSPSLANSSYQSVLNYTEKLLEFIESESFEELIENGVCREFEIEVNERSIRDFAREFATSDKPEVLEKILRDIPQMTPIYSTPDKVWFELDKSKYGYHHIYFHQENGEWCLKN